VCTDELLWKPLADKYEHEVKEMKLHRSKVAKKKKK